MAYGIILLVDPSESGHLIEYSHALAATADSYMELGDAAPAHVTILHADATERDAYRWWGDCKSFLPREVELSRAGLTFESIAVGDAYFPRGGATASVAVIRDFHLNEIHQRVLEVANSTNISPRGAFGNFFRPHVTLTAFYAFPSVPMKFDSSAVSGPIVGRPALGRLGPFGTFPTILDS